MPGHWEGDLIIGLNRSAIGTVVERSTRFTMLVHLPRMEGYGVEPRVHNGPALAGYGAEAMRDALASRFTTLPDQLRRSLTWHRGKELSQHAQLKIDTGLAIYLTRTARGSAGPTRTPTGSCASTSPRAPTCRDGAVTRWKLSPLHSTRGPARRSAGRHPPRPSTSTYARCNKPVLRQPVESRLGEFVPLAALDIRAPEWCARPCSGP